MLSSFAPQVLWETTAVQQDTDLKDGTVGVFCYVIMLRSVLNMYSPPFGMNNLDLGIVLGVNIGVKLLEGIRSVISSNVF
ncbi:hypothetical protein C0995_009348 [Termitomyces sp. Mi166|nr:hypothetical protein C0995_009348 [Termitomyces sp. Mi166\